MLTTRTLGHRRGELVSDGLPLVMGVLNVTPDSFSDGGRHAEVDDAVAHALRLLGDGAHVIDVGGESTRPGASEVDADEEIARVVPVILALRARTSAVISVDTWKAPVAAAALAAGADIVNDVGALAWDPAMGSVCAQAGAGVVLMHAPDSRSRRHAAMDGPDIAGEVTAMLKVRVEAALHAGIAPGRLVVDPGFGFGKTADQNHELLAELERVVALGWPVLVGVSRKRLIREVVGQSAQDIEAATVAAHVWAALQGAAIVRTHDVASTVAAFRLLGAIGRHTASPK